MLLLTATITVLAGLALTLRREPAKVRVTARRR